MTVNPAVLFAAIIAWIFTYYLYTVWQWVETIPEIVGNWIGLAVTIFFAFVSIILTLFAFAPRKMVSQEF